ncbi:MAG: hypothetical protein HP494_05560 [Nitrospira sp.]|nr:hypothetical protein [Nitrospira sp.]
MTHSLHRFWIRKSCKQMGVGRLRSASPPRHGQKSGSATEGILAAAKERAQRLMEENEQRMTVEAERIKGDATREIDRERRKAIQDIRAQTTGLALLVAEKVVQRSLNEADNRKFADDALEALSKSYQQ